MFSVLLHLFGGFITNFSAKLIEEIFFFLLRDFSAIIITYKYSHTGCFAMINRFGYLSFACFNEFDCWRTTFTFGAAGLCQFRFL